MARNIFKRLLPDPEWVKAHPSLAAFGSLLHDPNLWHLNRRSVSLAFLIGLWVAFIPIPSQMLLSGLLAILLHANLPLSVLLVWVTNPLTMPVIFFLAYKVGAFLMDVRVESFRFELSWDWLMNDLLPLWQPFLLGCLVCGAIAGVFSSFVVNALWRAYVIHRWRKRRELRLARKTVAENPGKAPR